eukprot:1766000-Rhodomonas_salina.1
MHCSLEFQEKMWRICTAILGEVRYPPTHVLLEAYYDTSEKEHGGTDQKCTTVPERKYMVILTRSVTAVPGKEEMVVLIRRYGGTRERGHDCTE